MTIPTALSAKSLRLPIIRVLKWPQFKPGHRIADAIEAYARAISIPYLVATGLDVESLASRERRLRKLDY